MMTREEVINGLQEVIDCEIIVYLYRAEAIECAIEMLKAQEPRLLTPDDFNDNPDRDTYGNLPCWLESREPLVASAWNRWNEDDFIRPQTRNFRPWTSRPTDAQREATPWE